MTWLRDRGPQHRRICFVIGTANQGGAEGQMVRLACELRRRGEAVEMLFLAQGGVLSEQLDRAGVPWTVMRRPDWPPSSTGRNVAALVRLAWSLARSQPSIVMAWLPGAVWPATIMARVLTRARCIAGFRGAVNYKKRHWETPFLRIAVRLAHVVTVNSPSLKPLASEWGADDRRLRLLPNGVDLPSTQADVTPTPPTAVVVANYRWYKGHATLIEALGSVKSDVVVRLCGEGDERPGLEDQVSRRGLDGRVVFVEPPADVAGELERAQFAIHPSHQEGLPNAVLEELSFGLPVVATNVGGTSLLVEDGVTGRLVPPNDHEALASAIDDLAGNATHRKSMAVDARLRAERFGWPECVRRYVALFDELLGVDP